MFLQRPQTASPYWLRGYRQGWPQRSHIPQSRDWVGSPCSRVVPAAESRFLREGIGILILAFDDPDRVEDAVGLQCVD